MSTEVVVYEGLDPCLYLPGRLARMPLRYPAAPLAPAQFDACLAAGDRRTGPFLYRTTCPTCRACEPIRLDMATFCPNRTQRRVLRKGDEALRTSIGPAAVSEERVTLFNAHRHGRGLAH